VFTNSSTLPILTLTLSHSKTFYKTFYSSVNVYMLDTLVRNCRCDLRKHVSSHLMRCLYL